MKKTKLIIIGLQILAFTLAPKLSFGWGDLGHGAVGEIADRNLTPRARGLVMEIIGPEPLALSAVWPDYVRPDDRFRSFSPYHYLEIPQSISQKSFPVVPAYRAKQDAHTIIEQVPLMLAKDDLSLTQKAVLLRYLVHVVGDVHQPLHVGNGVDMGGNLCQVKVLGAKSGKEFNSNLHKVWDEDLIEYFEKMYKDSDIEPKSRYYGYREMTELVLKNIPRGKKYGSKSKLPANQWYVESQELHGQVYPDPLVSPTDRVYCKQVDPETKKVVDGKFDSTKIPSLGADYIQRSLEVIQERVYIAGLRLAVILDQIAEARGTEAWTSEMQDKYFEEILIKN